MIILEAPYTAPEQLAWLEKSKHPVLDNAWARSFADGYKLNLVSEGECVRALNASEPLYTNSENALGWVRKHVSHEGLLAAIDVCKDKALLREKLSPLYPNFEYRCVSEAELFATNASSLNYPVVIKPNVGFCSLGVYVLESEEDFYAACKDIKASKERWLSLYPESVLEPSDFIIESYITGVEYALDMYFDADGKPCIVNILRHDFLNEQDTSDRLYYCGISLVRELKERFEQWLLDVNSLLKIRNFAIHIELRYDGKSICPIEFNPARFAGLGGTEVSYYGFGFVSYEMFLKSTTPNWEELAKRHEGMLYAMSLMPAPSDIPAQARFNLEAFSTHVDKILGAHVFDHTKVGSLAFIFSALPEDDTSQREFILSADMHDFII